MMATPGRGGESECDTGDGENDREDGPIDGETTVRTLRNMPTHTSNSRFPVTKLDKPRY
jgi:hypothetical protein